MAHQIETHNDKAAFVTANIPARANQLTGEVSE